MSTRFIDRVATTGEIRNAPDAAGVGIVSGDLHVHDGTLVQRMAKSGIVSVTAATLAVSKLSHADRLIVLNRAAGITVTLPAATGSGDHYRFTIGIALSAASHVIAVANANDQMRGVFLSKDDGSASSIISWATANSGTLATESDTITLDGSTKGGNLGDDIEIEDIAANLWKVKAVTKSSGTEATPFSAAV